MSVSRVFRPERLKSLRPQIESPTISYLQIDHLNEGIVWSGVYDGIGIVPGTRDPLRHYAEIETFYSGAIGPASDVFIKNFDNFKVKEDVFGHIYVPELRASETMVIDGGLRSAVCCGSVTGCAGPYFPANTSSFVIGDAGCLPVGKISIRDAAGLHGQIILNADNDISPAADAWAGEVILGDDDDPNTNPIIISPHSNDPYHAPYYTVASAFLGGGAIGLVPFRIYEADCEPQHLVRTRTPNPALPTGAPDDVPSGAFGTGGGTNASIPVKIRFYGPIELEDTTIIEGGTDMTDVVCTSSGNWTNFSDFVLETRPPGSRADISARTVGLSIWEGTQAVRPGKYRVRVPAIADTDFVPDAVPVEYWQVCTSPNPVSVSRAYYFRVSTGAQVDCVQCPQDFNCSGIISVQDIFDFLAAWFGGCTASGVYPCQYGSADFNGVNGVSIQDLFDFLAAWFGPC